MQRNERRQSHRLGGDPPADGRRLERLLRSRGDLLADGWSLFGPPAESQRRLRGPGGGLQEACRRMAGGGCVGRKQPDRRVGSEATGQPMNGAGCPITSEMTALAPRSPADRRRRWPRCPEGGSMPTASGGCTGPKAACKPAAGGHCAGLVATRRLTTDEQRRLRRPGGDPPADDARPEAVAPAGGGQADIGLWIASPPHSRFAGDGPKRLLRP